MTGGRSWGRWKVTASEYGVWGRNDEKFSNGDGYTLYEITKKEVYCML